ncbi:MAG: quinone-interacting membrane-bound oxidoreductase complex subunit QmoC [Deltaproteobacteria bacterium]|nr:quinone-interacting membrane-bound oxidoreductase complex subunit QmoC [Deltaproteobacteria bacterium]
MKPVRMEPDLQFIRTLGDEVGPTFKKCFQCGTCSTTCELSPEIDPFPRKEMAWAVWGQKDRLLADPDVWLCHQCNDCSTRCPRNARPGDVLAAIRREQILHYAFPRFVARWLRQPRFIPFLLAIPAVLLTAARLLRDPLGGALGFSRFTEDRISYSFSSEFPHWLINSFFGFFSLLVLIITIVGVWRFWQAMKTTVPPERLANPAKGLGASILSTLKTLWLHERFTKCGTTRSRYSSHMLVFYGFLALCVVTLWVITGKHNPLISHEFVYPFPFWSPWKALANLAGLAIATGCLLMIRDRLKQTREAVGSTYYDWAFILLLLFVVLTGFGTEVMHFARMEPHRHIMYFLHLVLIFALLMYLPYSKLAHVVYRLAALIFAERTGREIPRVAGGTRAEPAGGGE